MSRLAPQRCPPLSWVMPAFGETAFGQNRIWPRKSEFGQFVFVTAFGQFWCFGQNLVLSKLLSPHLLPCCCWCLLLPLVVAALLLPPCCCRPVVAALLLPPCCCRPVVAALLLPPCCCRPVLCWCCPALFSVGACCLCVWWVCSRFLGLSPGPPSAGPPFPWTAQNFALFFLSPAGNFFLSSLSGCLLVEFWWCFEGRNPEMCTFERPGASNTTKIPRESPQREKKE